MKINEIIRQRRIEKQLTQEQMADLLGVSAPAVNKWEKGLSYPDITLLPPIARLLDTDLNTLLSFKDDLTPKEVSLFINDLSETADRDGRDRAFEKAFNKLKEYPSCHLLTLNIALWLDGSLMLNPQEDFIDKYSSKIEDLYYRIMDSPDESIKNQAVSMLISKAMVKEDYDQVQSLLQLLPEPSSVDKKQLSVNLSIAQGHLEDAARTEEERLITAANNIQTIILTLMDIALRENRTGDARYIAQVSRQCAKILDLWEYNRYVAHFQFYSVLKDPDKCAQTLIPMLKAIKQPWEPGQSPLYRHLTTKRPEKDLAQKYRENILQILKDDPDMAFLRESSAFQPFIETMERESSADIKRG